MTAYMNNKITISLLLTLLFAFACDSSKKSDTAQRNKALIDSIEQAEIYVWPDSIEMVFDIADSLRTPVQKALARSVLQVRFDHTEVKDGYLVFDMSREEFIGTGLPEPYYHFIVSRTNEYNYFLYKWSSMSSDTLNDVWEKRKEGFRKELLKEEAIKNE